MVVHDGQISPSGVGYDIACENKAVRTSLSVEDIQPELAVFTAVGRQEHDKLKALVQSQLGTVGSGNHFVDLFEEIGTGRVDRRSFREQRVRT